MSVSCSNKCAAEAVPQCVWRYALLDACGLSGGMDGERIGHDGKPARQIRPVERHCEKEAQGRDRAVDARRLHADPRLVQLEQTQVLHRRRVGRAADKGCECPYVARIAGP
jgi:hypothetical protein